MIFFSSFFVIQNQELSTQLKSFSVSEHVKQLKLSKIRCASPQIAARSDDITKPKLFTYVLGLRFPQFKKTALRQTIMKIRSQLETSFIAVQNADVKTNHYRA